MEIRPVVRRLARDPGFTIIAILTLAGGIGANTAIFSMVHGVLLRTLPFPEPERLFAVQEFVPKFAHLTSELPVSARHYGEWKKQSKTVESFALLDEYATNLISGGDAERLPASRVSFELFPMLGIRPLYGRLFRAEEDAPGANRVVLLSHALWTRRFQGDPSIVGQFIRLDGEAHQVVGVLPPAPLAPRPKDLQGMMRTEKRPELYKPLGIRPEDTGPIGDFNYACLARLRLGATREQAEAELSTMADNVARLEVPDAGVRAALVPLQDQLSAASRQGLWLLLAAVGAVLLITCVNLANLLLARALTRRREIAIRAALGAGRPALVRLMLADSLALAAAGGLLGLLLARWGLLALLAIAPSGLPRMEEIRIDLPVMLFALALTGFTGVLFGILPALRFSCSDPQAALKAGSHTVSEGRQSHRIRGTLVGAEVALSVVCLVAAGLLLHSFVRLLQVDTGFATERILTVELSLPENRYDDAAVRTRFYRQALSEAASISGTVSAGISNLIPLKGTGSNNILLPEGAKWPLLERPLGDFRMVNHDYFGTMSIPMLQGRAFDESDGERKLAVISASVAARLWPGQDAVGRRFWLGDDSKPPLEVIGVAADVRAAGLDSAPSLSVYLPYWQRSRLAMTLALRTAMNPISAAQALRTAIRRLDPEVPLGEIRTMRELVSAATAQRRFHLTLVLIFAAAALLLASLGIYGVIAQAVLARRNEIGIRLALGAAPGRVLAMLFHQGLAPVWAGLAAGLAAAFALGRWIQGMLFGIRLADPLTFGIVTATLLIVAGAACFGPALRASRTDPALTLRYE